MNNYGESTNVVPGERKVELRDKLVEKFACKVQNLEWEYGPEDVRLQYPAKVFMSTDKEDSVSTFMKVWHDECSNNLLLKPVPCILFLVQTD